MPPVAQFETRTAFLSEEFGETMARKWFGDAIVDALPRYVRGKRAGKIKGIFRWTKVVRGGWVRTRPGEGGGYVENRRGSIIERELCELGSDRDGVYVGRVLYSLGCGETMESRAAEEAARKRRVARDGVRMAAAYRREALDNVRILRGEGFENIAFGYLRDAARAEDAMRAALRALNGGD